MKLTKIQVKNFRSIDDSGEFEINDLTCLVGKNEAGKTAILRAIHGLAPTDNFKYDKTRDYPRRFLSKFDERHPKGSSEVCISTWQLSDEDLAAVLDLLGEDVLTSSIITVTSLLGETGKTLFVSLDEGKCLRNLEARYGLTPEDKIPLEQFGKTSEALETLKNLPKRSESQEALMQSITKFRDGSARLAAIDILNKRLPHFFYTSHFERMSGEISLKKLTIDKQQNTVEPGDKIFLDFLEYAGTTIEELLGARKYEDLIAKCEGASNDITDEIFEFWSQNDALSVKIDLNEGQPEDKPPFNEGRVAQIRIENKNHRVTVPLSERSAGFVWFFSFLSQFKQLKKSAGNTIILLDEPGLTLHGKAQSDLLRYIEERILPDHQVIYTTHSPFMVPTQRLSDVRVVEDLVDFRDPRRPVVHGTKVSADVLSVGRDTLFPLQAHLGYEITQSLFIGKHCILVEGPSDVIFLQVASRALQARKRTFLDPRWTICPTGGLDKITSFASLFSGNNLNIVTLCDYGTGDKKKVERLRETQILKVGRVLTAADFSGKPESDIEDLFDPDLYCDLVTAALGLENNLAINRIDAERGAPNTVRIVKQVEAACRLLPPDTPQFGHFLPADWLLRHPEFFDGDTPEILRSLEKFEAVFNTINQFIE